MIMSMSLMIQFTEINDLSSDEEKVAYRKHVEDSNKVSCVMITSMCFDLQKTFENTWVYEMNR